MFPISPAIPIFVAAIIIFVLAAVIVKVFLCLWIYHDAKAKSEQEPSLWVLVVIFLSDVIGLIVYFLVGRTKKDVPTPGTYKKPLIISALLLIPITIFFVLATINFVVDETGGDMRGSVTMSSGTWMGRNSSYRDNRWIESVRSGSGTSRRDHTLTAEQMRNFHVNSTNADGELFLQIAQGDFLSRIDISHNFYENLDLHYHGFVPGRMRIALQYERVRHSQTVISWRAP